MTGRLDAEPKLALPGFSGWLRAVPRGLALIAVVFGGFVLLLPLRLIERPLCGMARPITPFVTQAVCRLALLIMRLRRSVRGGVMTGPGAVVANHASWLDILVLNATDRVYFVSKAEVSDWAGVGWLARATGTLFITREARDAGRQQALFEERLGAGHRLLFFPEGTSTDGWRVLPFKSTLFAAFFQRDLKEVMQIQPVSLIYHAPDGQDARFYGWWGDMGFAPHLLAVLASPGHGRVEVVLHPPLAVAGFAGRKALSAACEAAVRAAHPGG